MKTHLLILLFFISFIGFSQNNYIVKTEDGRRVLLKTDYTWEYIDAESPVLNSVVKEKLQPAESSGCNLAQDFVEPELDKNIQIQLKRGRATMEDIKKKVAKEYKCEVEDVVLLSATEDKAKGAYDFCANGTKVSYKRNGHTVVKKGQFL
ncbi:DUF3157 family protein [Confluentibacter flavum]|uniref:DUF3157 domain-containing protein n=1 Tax=Confluentibacter flavum TaxID=1909700 RepID=A0A2N3HMB5_9FLAO|nr:DUF3157 family protein [Confluentibacter flavum]PKQ45988.1 DUF3157 domain-containing protein [Confluentibacter flavum]